MVNGNYYIQQILFLIMSKPYFSIVTPVFNRPQFLEQTIKSVLSQQFKNYEYIIVDGKSKPTTLNILNKYKSKIQLISEKDNGMYDALHKGFSIASGKYFMWLNTDDFFLDKKSLLRLYNHLQNFNNHWIRITFNRIKRAYKWQLFLPKIILLNNLININNIEMIIR